MTVLIGDDPWWWILGTDPRGQDPPFGGPPNLIQIEKTARACS